MYRTNLNRLLYLASLLATILAANNDLQPVLGTKCLPNQVVTKLTVYEDGAIEAECNKLPCGISGAHCNDNQTSCRAETDTFSGMKWASNGQSIVQRCCTLSIPRKIYVGTDLVSLGSYYTGGSVDKKDLYGKEGPEFDFVTNIRTEQGGVRVWVFRVICPKPGTAAGGSAAATRAREMVAAQAAQSATGRPHGFEKHRQFFAQKQVVPNANIQPDEVVAQGGIATAYRPVNPLQYRPANWRQQQLPQQRDSPIDNGYRGASERLI